MFEKVPAYDNNPEESSTTKISKQHACGCLLFTHYSFHSSRRKYDFYRGTDCMKKFCLDLRKHATETINYEKNKMFPLTHE